ncbi:MAG: imidazoleglycerol-phosphate dehydratase HisB [Deltaproteobacteria bacterium]|nr:imidazoleglycerol-phosphate dehydratase HisB [Deltaproteobacteria bacterium]
MRQGKVHRKTNETDVTVEIDLDGTGNSSVDTTIPFIDHMISLMAKHGLLDVTITAYGDTQIDYHHLMEDLGITLGQAISRAVGDKHKITRYGQALIPMDEALAEVVLDLSGRPYLVYHLGETSGNIKELPVSLFEDFFMSVCTHAMMNLHINLRYGRDLHHIFESIFKAFGKALSMAGSINDRMPGLPTTKGIL